MAVHIKLNGKPIDAEQGQTILQVAQQHGYEIPTLCYHKDLNPTGNCRMCVVEVKGGRFLQAACVTPVWEGMDIETHSPKVVANRKLTLEMMLANHPMDCISCEATGHCELQDRAYEYQAAFPEFGQKNHRVAIDSDPNPFIRVDMNRCILCRRCVSACAEIQVRDVWGVAKRGIEELIVAGANTTMLEARCESCGQCVAYCPTGALTNKPNYGTARAYQVKKVTTTCGYCGVGCTLDLLVKDDKVIGVESNPDAPVNGMALCVKGRYGYDFIHHPERLTKPRVRKYLLAGESKETVREYIGKVESASLDADHPWSWVETDWKTVLDLTAGKLRQTRNTYGPNSMGVFTSAKCTNEENFIMNKFARQVLGTNNIDHCARL